ncbi:unnamed protein product [Oikopleura dioica]|uniref:Uncharacterized protein n=1 Tax=Oikopleura dioica TaxID=34765 RepID=E4Y3H7_OIKDI|nr:unnamed protein product [Oikopleura dioica]
MERSFIAMILSFLRKTRQFKRGERPQIFDHGRLYTRARSKNRSKKRPGSHVSSTHHESFFKENRIHHSHSQTSSTTLTPLSYSFYVYLILLHLFLLLCSNTKKIFPFLKLYLSFIKN